MEQTVTSINEVNYLTAMAVFQQLYDKKIKVFDIICEFIKYYINSTCTYNFTLEQIHHEINEYYNFSLPTAIIRSAIKKIDYIEKTPEGDYFVESSRNTVSDNSSIFKPNISKNDKILKGLIDYVESKINRKLRDEEKSQMFEILCYFLLDYTGYESDSEFKKYIVSYLIDISRNQELQKQLDDINEGLIIYKGITSDLDTSKYGSWKNKLTLYLDMEILFDIIGYNGMFFKQQGNDFINLVKEINKKDYYIELKYFDTVEDEINKFFKSASAIVTGKANYYRTVAMQYIVEHCHYDSDVVLMKVKFFDELKKLNICCDCTNYYDNNNNYKYTIKDEPMLSKINILRKGVNEVKIQNIKYLLITGTRIILNKSKEFIDSITNPNIEENNEEESRISPKPLAKSLEDITKLFWFSLNKGFGQSHKLESFDVLHKGKIVLASIIHTNIKDVYSKLNQQFLEGEVTADVAASCVAELRSRDILPEHIESNNTDFVLNLIDSTELEAIKNEKVLKDKEIEKLRQSNKLLNDSKLKDAETIAKLTNEISEYNLKKKLKKNNLIFILKVIILIIAFFAVFFVITKWALKYIHGDNKIITLIGFILSIIGAIPFFVIILKKIKNKFKQSKDNIINSSEPSSNK